MQYAKQKWVSPVSVFLQAITCAKQIRKIAWHTLHAVMSGPHIRDKKRAAWDIQLAVAVVSTARVFNGIFCAL